MMYYDNALMQEISTLDLPSIPIGDGVQGVFINMQDNQELRKWELHTVKDTR
jgi:hypothetical protein